jgi:uncharacterized protein (TIGR02118 family)
MNRRGNEIRHVPLACTAEKDVYFFLSVRPGNGTLFRSNLYFDSAQALQAALTSPEGQAAAGDLQNFATAGVILLAGEVERYGSVSIG